MNFAALQQAVWTRLNAEVGGSFVGIYKRAPQPEDAEKDSAFPYITLGYILSDYSDKTQTGTMGTVQVHVWHRTRDNLASAALYDAVHAALDRYSLPIGGTDYANCTWDSADEMSDPDGKTTHAVIRFRVNYFNT